MVTGEDTQASRVNAEALGQSKLGREIGDLKGHFGTVILGLNTGLREVSVKILAQSL